MKPFLSGKRTLETEPLCSPHNHKTVNKAGARQPASEGPTVEVEKQGDKITRIVITCTCGERVEVDCLYPAGS